MFRGEFGSNDPGGDMIESVVWWQGSRASIVLLLLAAPLSAGYGMQRPGDQKVEVIGRPASVQRVWPEPPEAPRIAFRATIASGRDISKGLRGFAKFRAMFEGTKETVTPVQRPYDVVAGLGRRLYVTDGLRNQVMVFDPNTRAAKPLGIDGPGQLVKPMGLAIDESGNVYVADPGSKRVVAFTPADAFLRSYGGAELLLNPVGVAVDSKAGVVYIADSYLHQVLVFRRSDGALLRRIGRTAGDLSAKQRAATLATSSHGRGAGPVPVASGAPATPGHEASRSSEPSDVVANRGVAAGEFRYPSFVAVGPNGTLYVNDALNARVQVFDRDGRFVRQVGQLGDGPGSFARPKGIALDSEGHLYVADAAFNNVQIFDNQGRLLLAFGQMGRGEGDLDLPLGLFIDQHDRIYVADRTNNRLQIFEYLRAGGR